ncbi:hypothetical protein Pth03_57080 [Planotetraspora thailandica]|uniref:Signal transduction histidine-protein kinase/phosphatase MprB n=1 Tax=Planotetraspora thailandica TaxID=487172 RepID=A0A8J3XY03_9ACTN|nr:DUF4153 domain-containing protein [Planotetraspora thailandica]GII57319.1 hypothetical protein Pth03_57080 [Planotetraspora thailandica]
MRPLDFLGRIKVKLGIVIVLAVVTAFVVNEVGINAGLPRGVRIAIAAVLALIMVQLLAMGMTKPLREMAAAAQTVAKGRYGMRVSATSRDEVGELARAFNAMAADLGEVDRQRRELVANVSHELRTPITGLQAVLENVVDGVSEPDIDTLGTALAQTQRLGRLVAQLLDLSRLDSGARPLEAEVFDLRSLCRQAVNEVGLAREGVTVESDVPHGTAVLADPALLAQVLANLLDNAVRHSPPGETVRLEARSSGSDLEISVIDRGPGIPDAERTRIFERFSRLDAGRAADAGGAGLGLAITREIVELHGGSIRAAEPDSDVESGRDSGVTDPRLPDPSPSEAQVSTAQIPDVRRRGRGCRMVVVLPGRFVGAPSATPESDGENRTKGAPGRGPAPGSEPRPALTPEPRPVPTEGPAQAPGGGRAAAAVVRTGVTARVLTEELQTTAVMGTAERDATGATGRVGGAMGDMSDGMSGAPAGELKGRVKGAEDRTEKNADTVDTDAIPTGASADAAFGTGTGPAEAPGARTRGLAPIEPGGGESGAGESKGARSAGAERTDASGGAEPAGAELRDARLKDAEPGSDGSAGPAAPAKDARHSPPAHESHPYDGAPYPPSRHGSPASGGAYLGPPPPSYVPPPLFPRPELPDAPRWLLLAAGAVGLVAALALPYAATGLGLVITAIALGAGVFPALIATGRQRITPWTVAFGIMAYALVSVALFRDADWLVWPLLTAAFCIAALGISGAGAGWLSALRGGLSVVLAVFPLPWFLQAPTKRLIRHRRVLPLLVSIGITLVLLLVFGVLFVSADAVFSAFASEVLQAPDWASSLPVRIFLFIVFAVGAAAAVLVALRPVAEPAGPDLRISVSRTVWVIPLVGLDVLFASFVAVQITVLFGGNRRVLSTAGLTYAEYARSGFFELVTVSVFVLGIVGAMVGLFGPKGRKDQRLLAVLLGLLCAFTLVILASALHRLGLYTGAYGWTRLRASVGATIWWLAAVFVLALIAGAVWLSNRGTAWLPRTLVMVTGICLLAFAVWNPDVRVAETQLTVRGVYRLDHDYLGDLGAEAVPTLDRLPEPIRSCVLRDVVSVNHLSQPDPWNGWNLAREQARDVLAKRPLSAVSCAEGVPRTVD